MNNPSATCVLLREASHSRHVDLLLPIANEDVPVLSRQYENDSYTYCGGRLHVVLMTRVISLSVLPLYFSILVFMIHFGNATSIMFAAIILGSVAASTVYGAFKGSKMCLIPFLFLHIIFFIYDLVLVCLLAYSVVKRDSFLSSLFMLLSVCIILLLFLPPLVWTTHVVYLDFIFISELDETLEFLREMNENCSKDDGSPHQNDF